MSRHNFHRHNPELRRKFQDPEFRRRFQKHRSRDKAIFGSMLALIGVVLILKMFGVFAFANIYSLWPVGLILLGLFIGLKSRFNNVAWLILIVIGIAKMTPVFTIMGHPSSEFAIPALFILGGLTIIMRRKRHPGDRCRDGRHHHGLTTNISAENTVNIDVTFGGRKEIVTSKDFKGGNISATFGGCEVNMLQADSTESTIVINIKASFSGVELVVPSHWDVQNEIDPSFASVDDERVMQTATTAEERKTLILRGTCSFGSIEIKSY